MARQSVVSRTQGRGCQCSNAMEAFMKLTFKAVEPLAPGMVGTKQGKVLIGLLLLSSAALGQKPIISAVVNGASYANSSLSGGSIGVIFGKNLATSTQWAVSTPLPVTLGSTKVSFFGIAAPLFYVSPTQINFQVPSPPNDGGMNDQLGASMLNAIVVVTDAGASDPQGGFGPDFFRLGVFTLDSSGCGQGIALNDNPDEQHRPRRIPHRARNRSSTRLSTSTRRVSNTPVSPYGPQ